MRLVWLIVFEFGVGRFPLTRAVFLAAGFADRTFFVAYNELVQMAKKRQATSI
jgi:hypothetical protein